MAAIHLQDLNTPAALVATGAQFPEHHAVSGQKVGSTWPRFYGW